MRAYDSIVAHFEKINHFEGARSMLHWDGAAMMPVGGAEARSAQISALSVLIHQLTCDPKVLDWLNIAEAEVAVALNSGNPKALGWAHSNLYEVRRAVQHASAVPEQLVRALSEAGSKCEMVWREARADDDFPRLKPYLEQVLKLTREVACIKADALGVTPYEALLDQYEPGASESSIDAAFAQLSLSLPQLIEEALAAQEARNLAYPIPELAGPFSIQNQRALGVQVMDLLGFDFNHGRLDVSHHPFCGGTPSDVRITTRYNEHQFTQSLMGVIHETGHALYEQGLPNAYRSQPVGKARGMSVHESQSLFWEMQIGRSEAFISVLAPLVAEAFAGDPLHPSWSVEGLRREYTRVERSLIRVDADEVTYPAHVILRYNLERNLLNADLEIADLPDAWNAEMQRLVGITPPSNRDGCMQDIHWMDGAFGYFPTYTLGAMTAAQLFETVKGHIPDVHDQIRAGDLKQVLSWLRDHVHAQGSRLSTDELLTQATGRPLEVTPFIKHLRTRYIDEVTEGLSRAPAPFTLNEEDVELSTTGIIVTQELVDNALELVSDPPLEVHPIIEDAAPVTGNDLSSEEETITTSISEPVHAGEDQLEASPPPLGHPLHIENDLLDLDPAQELADVLDIDQFEELDLNIEAPQLDELPSPPPQDFDDFASLDGLDGLESFESIDGLNVSDGPEDSSHTAPSFSESNDESQSDPLIDPTGQSTETMDQDTVFSQLDPPSTINEDNQTDFDELFDEIDEVVADMPPVVEDSNHFESDFEAILDEESAAAFEQVNTQALFEHLHNITAPKEHNEAAGNENQSTDLVVSEDTAHEVQSWSLEGELKLAEELSEALDDLDDFNQDSTQHQDNSPTPDENSSSVVGEDSISPITADDLSSTVVNDEFDPELLAELAADYLAQFSEDEGDLEEQNTSTESAADPLLETELEMVNEEEMISDDEVAEDDPSILHAEPAIEAQMEGLDLDIGMDPGPSAYAAPNNEGLDLDTDLNDKETQQGLNTEDDTLGVYGYAQEAIELMDSYQPLPGSDYPRSRPVKDRVRSIIAKTTGIGEVPSPQAETDGQDSSLGSQSQTTRDDHPSSIDSQDFTQAGSHVEDAGSVTDRSVAQETDQINDGSGEGDSQPPRKKIFKLR